MPAQLVLVRVDDRLIHGQVAIGWVKATTPEYIVVANDAVAADPMQRSLMELAAPPSVDVVLCPVAGAAALCAEKRLDGKRVLVLFSNPQDVLAAVESGLPVKQLNVGGMRYLPGKRQVLKSVSIDANDETSLRALIQRGLAVTVQMVPTDEPVDIMKFLTGMGTGRSRG